MSEPLYLSQEGLTQLKEELQFLKTKERARIAQAIAEARAQGDLSENAEYDAAKDAQGLLEARIAQIEAQISNARVVDDSKIDPSKAYILSKVTVKNHKSGQHVTYTLTSDREANFAQNKISVNSPIGKALLGKSVVDVVDIKLPAGALNFKTLEIAR